MTYNQQNIDALIVSTGRAGSTSLYNYLGEAAIPGLPQNKEPHFWCDIRKYGNIGNLLSKIYVDKYDDYFDLYRDSKIVLDASVGYFFCLDEVLKRLKHSGQSPKIIYLYREPVSRARSLYYEELKKGEELKEDLIEEISLEKDPGLWWENYYDNVAYSEVFSNLKKTGWDMICINQMYFKQNTGSVLSAVIEFLGLTKVADYSSLNLNSSAEAATYIRFPYLGRLLGSKLPGFKVLRRILPKIIGESIKYNASPGWRRLVEKNLPFSIQEFNKFRLLIQEKDIFRVETSRKPN